MGTLRRDSHSQSTDLQIERDVTRRDSASRTWQEVAARSEEVRQYRLEEADASLPNMFQKLRRNSRQIFHSSTSSKRSASVVEEPAPPDLSYLNLGKGRLTFFDLPAEIRNVIYEDVASETKLYVSCTAAKKKEKEAKIPPQTTPALLLVSKQTRIEYLPVLLERAIISFAIRDFDFRNLMRVSSSLYSSELKALRKNPRLTIRLLATKPTKDALASLRRWAQRRTEDLYTFPVRYALVWPKQTQLVPTSTSVHRINTYIQRRGVMMHTMDALAGLGRDVPEALQWELQPVVDVYSRELEALGGVSGSMRVDPWGDQWIVPMFGRP